MRRRRPSGAEARLFSTVYSPVATVVKPPPSSLLGWKTAFGAVQTQLLLHGGAQSALSVAYSSADMNVTPASAGSAARHPTLPALLFNIVDEESKKHPSCLSWCDDGNAFQIYDERVSRASRLVRTYFGI